MVIILVHIPKWHLNQFSSFCMTHIYISYTLQWAARCLPKSGPYYSSQCYSKEMEQSFPACMSLLTANSASRLEKSAGVLLAVLSMSLYCVSTHILEVGKCHHWIWTAGHKIKQLSLTYYNLTQSPAYKNSKTATICLLILSYCNHNH